jgi:hypothetical protein
MLTPEWTPLLTVIQMISAVASWHPEAADVNRQDALCLARNIYFEARGEGLRSQFAVAAVTLNRARDRRWADGICGVVYQKKQFSWTLSRPMSRPVVINDRAAWHRATEVAILSLAGLAPDYSQGATHYVAPKRLRRMPVWTTAMDVSHRIDGHVFFTDRVPGMKLLPPRGPQRNAPKIMAPSYVAETRTRIERGGLRQTCGSIHLLPTVNVEAVLLLDPERPVQQVSHQINHSWPGHRNTPFDAWNDTVGMATERRIRTGARRLAAA